MFERYTEKARRVVFFARYEASHYGSTEIGTEHLLLGLLREDKSVFRWLPKTNAEAVRESLEGYLPKQPPTSTAVDLPLSASAKGVLKHASTEADRLASKQIGTEHLLLGLLDEVESFAAKLLRDGGADEAALRRHYAARPEPPRPWSFQRASFRDFGFRILSAETVDIHGSPWNVDYVRDVIELCREYNWHWHKAAWTPRDVAFHRKTGCVSFDLSLAAGSTEFGLIQRGWKKDYCLICHWELFESEGEHGTGYTNGHDWLCVECYERFWERPDFFSSSHSDIT